MKKKIIRKGLVLAVIILFIGACVVPIISGYDEDVKKNDYLKNIEEDYNYLINQKIKSGVFSNNDWFEQEKLLASDGEPNDVFGYCVSFDGDTAVIGAFGDDDNGGWSGSAYIFTRSGTNWTEQAKLLASDGATGDGFGWSVSFDGDTAVIGAPWDDDSKGSAYVFKRSGTSWTEQAKLLASDGATGDYFGCNVSIDGNYAIIGACGDDNSKGSAYVFKRSGTSWTEQAKLLASDGAGNDIFGWSVSIDGDTVIIGAFGDDDNGGWSGSAYIFTRSGTSWTEQAKLLASDGGEWDEFGWSVSIDGDSAVIGAPWDDDNGYRSGSAYIFTRSGTSWTEQAKLLASDGIDYHAFGYSIYFDGDTVVIGAPWDMIMDIALVLHISLHDQVQVGRSRQNFSLQMELIITLLVILFLLMVTQ